ncbi:acetyl-CoA carboxylase biotin carboxyl carrier protein subunit [Microvirga zambiensis]|jgi:acetyl-CoA carboxylase biotin carboxyl carrier protein|uniref:acetyl-CoA carboxylase biotin carboxyl carrier protein subunit n=1 Tax=Microvirga zambiensis TaxID=1402137 RepID=UPI00191DF7F1|nr:acetyl-CoA carboxylase biotin carboxyl carrier protein subunit [Microvirga zambiensis]
MSLKLIHSPIKALVWKVEVEAGQPIEEYDPLIILESMKTEIPVDSSLSGIVREVLVKEGDSVEENQPLVSIEAAL